MAIKLITGEQRRDLAIAEVEFRSKMEQLNETYSETLSGYSEGVSVEGITPGDIGPLSYDEGWITRAWLRSLD
jgi:hypothetical protein